MRGHEGRIVKVMGDGVLIEFASAVNAVEAALELQEKMAEANDALARGSPHRAAHRHQSRRRHRRGIGHLWRRRQHRGAAGGAGRAGRHLRLGQGARRSARQGRVMPSRTWASVELKNIANPVRVFRVANGAAPAAVEPSLSLPDKPSIAVLPFTNMSGDPEQQYFSDGITEDIITELSRSRSLFVIARNSSFQYRDKAVDVRRVARDLGVRYVVEGSVRKMGSRIRITAQLIDAVPGNHLWSERFDRGIEELFDVQDELTQTIVATVAGRLEDAEIRMASNKRTDSLPAYDCLLRGIQHLRGYGPDDNRRARELFEQAVALDPRYALAHAYLALSLLVENSYGGASDAIKQRALDVATTAVRLDPRESRCHTFLGQVYRFRDEYDLAISHLERGVVLNPNDAIGIVHLGASAWRLRSRRRGHRTGPPGHQARSVCEVWLGHPCALSVLPEALRRSLGGKPETRARQVTVADGARGGLPGTAWTSRRSSRPGRRSAPPQAGFQRAGGDAALQISCRCRAPARRLAEGGSSRMK